MNAYSLYNRVFDRIKLPFRKEKEFFSSLYSVLGFYPRSSAPYRQALLHKSMHLRERGRHIDNERLEYLGDAILGAAVGDIVFHRFPGKREGFLTTTRSRIVQRDSLNRVAKQIGLDRLIMVQSGNRSHNNNIAGNAFEALIGAIYIDRGYNTCMAFLQKRIIGRCINLDKVSREEINFKSKLLEWSQKHRVKLDFCLIDQHNDANHNPQFTTLIRLESTDGEMGFGYSKKESHQQAAKQTYHRLMRDHQFMQRILQQAREREKLPIEN